ncbi:leucine-rich repeat receptor-like protein kinase PXC2 [Cornus florida]|uniref:leucine-rich repeat receptor-like protein kinase PXC2 n=1 Tax=Cornus florida TaxID=4283 RepID=UPI00289B698F|nr:leucine-rich repeat receptor-like protein kinase PXC2 [Cornus florida]
MAKSMRDVCIINIAIVFVLTFDTIVVLCSGNNNSDHVACVESERQALLRFKQHLRDPSNRLFSWGADQSGGDCCEWVGVVCNSLTGNVEEIHLQNPFFDAVLMGGFLENAILVIKGQMAKYSTILQLVTSMDFSDNNLSGEIPEELTNLRGLHSLNLSYNLLTGRIPKDIGAMEQLEAIDFSMNHLFVKSLQACQL